MRTLGRFVAIPAFALLPALAQSQLVEHTVATGLRFGYQAAIADLNGDGRLDLIGLGAQMSELLWFENPTWEQHVLVSDVSGMINTDAADVDGDGIPEVALAYGFSTVGARSSGEIAILRHDGDPTEPWTLTQIDAIPTAHRIRWADVDGNDEPTLIVAPIVNAEATSQADPDRLPTPLVYYRPGDWERETITMENLGAVHGILPWDSDGDGQQEVLTAGRLGVHSHRLGADGRWLRNQLSPGVPEAYPDGGSSDLGSGRFAGRPFFAAIEPFHGNQVVAYRQSPDGTFSRLVIDTEIVNGHAMIVADLSGNGNSEIVAAGTRGEPNLYLYRATDASGDRWERTIVDDAIRANSCAAGDINGDGRIDVTCIDQGAPNNLKWYENTGDW